MAKTLEYADTSAQAVKIGDTTTSFTMVLGEDSNPVDLTNATSIIAKLGNSTGYLKSQTVTSDNIPDPLSGQVIIKFDSDFMSGLPAGSYLLEVWVTYDSGVAIYPSGAPTGFTINNNIESQSGSVITSISYDDFVAAMNKAASTIAKGDKGDKGDTGTVDNAGLISAPAFQSLQTQVNNSAVGTNLLTNSNFSSGLNNWKVNQGTNADGKAVVTTDSDGDTCVHITGTGNSCGLYCWPVSFNQNQVTTGSIFVKGTGTLNAVGLERRPFSNFGAISTDSYSKVGSTMQAASVTNAFTVYFNAVNGVLDIYVKFAKLEIGSVATDWCPNSAEILTQSDYAKIKAAIVALGGALS